MKKRMMIAVRALFSSALLVLGLLPQAAAQGDCELGPTRRFIELSSVSSVQSGSSCRFTARVVDSPELICHPLAGGGPSSTSYPVTVGTPGGDDDPCEAYLPPYTAWCRAGVSDAPLATTTPSGLVASTLGGTAVSLAWQDNSSYCGCDTCYGAGLAWQSFEVERRSAEGGVYTVIGRVGPGRPAFVDRQAVPGRSYHYRVQAHDAFGPSGYSNVAAVTVGAPAMPRQVRTSVISASRVDLSWRDGGDDEVLFEIERREGQGPFTPLATTPANTTTYSDESAVSSATYTYRVRAANATGVSPYANSGRVKPSAGSPFAPAAPCCLAARFEQANSGGFVVLGWSDVVTNEAGFRVERKGPGTADGWAVIAELPPSATLAADGPLAAGLYTYRVVAYHAGGDAASAEVQVTAR